MKPLPELEAFLQRSWERYASITPDAAKVHAFLRARGERRIVNDHVAYRTFGMPGIDRFALGAFFEAFGYKRDPNELIFETKKLVANYWLPPREGLPKVFISEMRVELFEKRVQDFVASLCATLRKARIDAEFFLKPSWKPIRYEDYQWLYPISEYAAWTAAFGIQLNHFTVDVSSLETFGSLEELNSALEGAGFALSDAGGVIKGKPADLLEQSSTRASRVLWQFDGGVEEAIPSCYYEFARRYADANTGKVFQGFLPENADKIFESTRG